MSNSSSIDNITNFIESNKIVITNNLFSNIKNIDVSFSEWSSYEYIVNIMICYTDNVNNMFNEHIDIKVCKTDGKYLFKHQCAYFPYPYLNGCDSRKITNDIINLINQKQ